MQQGFNAALGDAPAPQREGAGTRPASPEEERQYSQFVGMALKALSADAFLPKAEKILTGSGDTVSGMAQLGASVVSRLYESAKEQGKPIAPVVLLHGGAAVMQEIGEMAKAAGRTDVTPEDVETAYFMAADMMNDYLAQTGDMAELFAAEDEDEFLAQIGDEQVNSVRQRLSGARERQVQNMTKGI